MDFLRQRDLAATFSSLASRTSLTALRWLGNPEDIAAFIEATSLMELYEDGRLERLCPLGEGRTFHVEACKDTKTGGTVAVKRLRQSAGNSSDSKMIEYSLLQEMKMSTFPPLNNRNITQTLGFEVIYHFMEQSFTLSLVMEFSDIGSLAQYLEAGESAAQSSNWEQKRAFSIDIASGLEAIHRCRIVHGDVKPHNVLLFHSASPTPNAPLMAKLGDFGSAIIENTIFIKDMPRKLPRYQGTPLYIHPIIRERDGKVPFHIMPACDVFSFGLLLWSMYKGKSYYEADWNGTGSVSGIIQHFKNYLAQSKDSIPLEEHKVLESAFMSCVIDIDLDDIPPIVRDKTYETSFSQISIVKAALMQQRIRDDCGTFVASHITWQPFDMGNSIFLTYTFHDTGVVPWAMQQNLRQAYIDLIGDPHASASRKGKAALQLCSSSAIGFGCKKSIDDALEYLRTAATFRNNPAQLVCHRVFAAHGRPSPVLQTDLFPVYSLVDSDESLGQTSDEDMEEGDHWQSETDDEKMDNGDTYSEGEMDMREAQSHFANQSDWGSQSSYHGSDISTLYAVFHLSGGFDQEFRRLTDVCDNDYYCWSIRMFEQCNGNANTLASLSAFGRKFSGLQDEALFAHVRAEWNSQTEGPIVSLPLDDGTHLEAPLLHHALACRNKELATRLIELGVSLESVDSDGRTPLHVACCYGYGELARFLISKGAKASAKDYCGLFPLHWLWMFEDADIENIGDQLIHVAGADINASVEGSCKIDVFYGYKIQDTALHAAVAVRSLKAVLVLLKLGADVNSRPFDYSDTPLELAAQLHLPEIAQVLLKRGAGLRHENNRGVWAMHQVGEHMAPLVRWLLHGPKYIEAASDTIRILMDAAEREKIDPEMKDEDGFTAFDLALQEQGEDDYVIEAFLQCKMRLSDNALDMAVYGCASNEENASKVKLVLNAFKWTDFHLCRALKIGIRVGALHAVRLLLRHARIPLLHCKDEEQKMPLHWAAEAQKPSVLEYLIDEDADLNVLDGKGIPPLGYTISTASTESSKLLLNRGANVWLSEGEWQGSTILNFGVSTDYQSSRSMLRYLLSADLDEEKPRRFPMLHDKAVLDATDRGKGNTVLHRAAIIGDYEGVFSLVSAGASTQIRNNAGLEPLEAVEKKLQEVLTSSQQMTDHVSKLGKIITYLQSLRFWKSE